jgi:hypothetical protein
MIQVQYSYQANTIRYASHRDISDEERQLIEKYIHENIVTGKDIAQQDGVTMDYLGIDYKLIGNLNQFHAVKPFKNKEEKPASSNPFEHLMNKDIDKSVQNLINTSMENYYFEKIGNSIIEMRQILEKNSKSSDLKKLQGDLSELVKAYNQYAARKVQVKDLIPNALFSN